MTGIRLRAGLVSVAALALLGGCSTISSLTGGSSQPPAASSPSTVTGSSWRDSFLFGAASPPPIVKPDEDNRTINCPAVAVIDGTSALRVAKIQAGSQGVNYQATVSQFARECQLAGNTLNMRVGIEGRLLLGPEGRPGTFTVPVRVAVKDGEKVVYSRVTRETVTVPPDATQAPFVHIEEGIALPVGAQDPGEQYDVLIGFDPAGDTRPGPKRRRR